jgi:hypothetical protein
MENMVALESQGDSSANRRRPVGTLLVLIAIAAAALLLRTVRTPYFALSNDEVISLCTAHGTFVGYDTVPDPAYKGETFRHSRFEKRNTPENVALATIQDNGNAVLYYLALRAWCAGAGRGAMAARWLSIALGMLLLTYLFYMALKTLGAATALAATAIAAGSLSMLDHSVVIRGYALAIFLSLFSTWFFLQLAGGKRSRGVVVAYGLFTGLAFLSHYMSFYVPLAHAGFLLLAGGRNRLRPFLAGGAIAAAVVFCWVIAGGLAVVRNAPAQEHRVGIIQAVTGALGRQYETIKDKQARLLEKQKEAGEEEMVTWPVRTYSKDAVVPLYVFFSSLTGNALHLAGVPMRYNMILVFLFLVSAGWLMYKWRLTLPPFVKLCIAMAVFTVFTAGALALLSGNMTAFDYSCFTVPFFAVLTGYLLWRTAKEGLRRAGWPAFFIWLNVFCIPADWPHWLNVMSAPPGKLINPYATLAGLIEENYTPGDTVVFPTWYVAAATNLYLDDESMVQQVDGAAEGEVVLRGKVEEVVMGLAGRYR